MLATVAFARLAAQTPERASHLSPMRVAAQISLGTLAAPVGFFGTAMLMRKITRAIGVSDEASDRAGYIGAWTGLWVSTAAVPALVGGDGNLAAGLAGSAAGIGMSVLAVKLGNALYDEGRRRCGPVCVTLGLLAIGLPSIGATAAYNASRN